MSWFQLNPLRRELSHFTEKKQTLAKKKKKNVARQQDEVIINWCLGHKVKHLNRLRYVSSYSWSRRLQHYIMCLPHTRQTHAKQRTAEIVWRRWDKSLAGTMLTAVQSLKRNMNPCWLDHKDPQRPVLLCMYLIIAFIYRTIVLPVMLNPGDRKDRSDTRQIPNSHSKMEKCIHVVSEKKNTHGVVGCTDWKELWTKRVGVFVFFQPDLIKWSPLTLGPITSMLLV